MTFPDGKRGCRVEETENLCGLQYDSRPVSGLRKDCR